MLKAVLFDLSGVLYVGNTVIDGAVKAIERMQSASVDVRFITNTSQKTRQQIIEDLNAFGFSLRDNQLYTATDVAKDWLRQHQLRPFCLVHENIRSEFDDISQEEPSAVLIGDAVEGFNFQNLNRAFQLCQQGAVLVGIGYNRYYKIDDQLFLDAGPFIKAIEFASGMQATIVGKPSQAFYQQVLASANVEPSDALMVGDDIYGDIEGALNAGLKACLVRTGKYQAGDEDKIDGDFYLVDSVVDAVSLVCP